MISIAVGIGSNVGDSVTMVLDAAEALRSNSEFEGVRVSPLVGSRPVGPVDQGDFVNAVCTLRTELLPHEVMIQLQEIEERFGRVRKERWGPRILDLDLLYYGEQTFSRPGLELPHAHMCERGFVLFPLMALEPEWRHPVTGLSISELTQRWVDSVSDPESWVWSLEERISVSVEGACSRT